MQFQACAYCDYPNPVGTDHCNECGASLHLKPCRDCGAEVVARETHCPACQAVFPPRPVIDIDLPWTVSADDDVAPRVEAAFYASAGASAGNESEAEEVGAASPPPVAARSLVEKASELVSARGDYRTPGLPSQGDRGEIGIDSPLQRGLGHRAAPTRAGQGDEARVQVRPERFPIAPLPSRSPPRSSTLPVLALTLAGLVIAVALIFLIDYARPLDFIRQAAPPRTILPSGETGPASGAIGTAAPSGGKETGGSEEAIVTPETAAPTTGAATLDTASAPAEAASSTTEAASSTTEAASATTEAASSTTESASSTAEAADRTEVNDNTGAADNPTAVLRMDAAESGASDDRTQSAGREGLDLARTPGKAAEALESSASADAEPPAASPDPTAEVAGSGANASGPMLEIAPSPAAETRPPDPVAPTNDGPTTPASATVDAMPEQTTASAASNANASTTDAAPMPQPDSATASTPPTTPPATMNTANVMPSTGAPDQDGALPSAPAKPGNCRPELQALALCDKVAP